MKWLQFVWSGDGKQRRQREESLTRIADAGSRAVTKARIENEAASRDLTLTVERKVEETRPVRRLLKELINRINADDQITRLRKDHA